MKNKNDKNNREVKLPKEDNFQKNKKHFRSGKIPQLTLGKL